VAEQRVELARLTVVDLARARYGEQPAEGDVIWLSLPDHIDLSITTV